MTKHFSLSLFLFFTGMTAYGQWTSLNPGTLDHLFNVNFPAPDSGYVIQSSGEIRKSVDGGISWSYVNSNTLLWDFAFTSVSTGFGIANSIIYKTVDNGITWDTVYYEPGVALFKIYYHDSDFIYAIGDNGGVADSMVVLTSYNNGLDWTRRAFSEGGFGGLVGSYFIDAATGYANDFSTLFKTLDSGQTWVNLNADPNQAYNTLYFLSPDTGFALATVILRTTDGGLSWNQVNTNGNNTAFYDMKFINDSVGYVGGGNGISSGGILKTTDGGINWDLDTAVVQTFIAMSATTNALYVSGTGGALWKLDILSGLSENTLSQDNLSLFHDFTMQQFVLKGTKANGNILVYDSHGKLVLKIVSEDGNSLIDWNTLSSGLYLMQYINKDSFASFKGIKP